MTTTTADRLLDDLEALVRRHRALRHTESGLLHAELITAEVALQLAVARRAVQRTPIGSPVAAQTEGPVQLEG